MMPNATLRRSPSRSVTIPTGSCSSLPKICGVLAIGWWEPCSITSMGCATRGLIQLIKRAVDADIPVITAVPAHRFAAWLKYSDGMSVRLPCRRAALDEWWGSVAGGVNERRGACFCAFVK